MLKLWDNLGLTGSPTPAAIELRVASLWWGDVPFPAWGPAEQPDSTAGQGVACCVRDCAQRCRNLAMMGRLLFPAPALARWAAVE